MVTFAMDDLDNDDNYIDVKPEVTSDAAYQIKRQLTETSLSGSKC